MQGRFNVKAKISLLCFTYMTVEWCDEDFIRPIGLGVYLIMMTIIIIIRKQLFIITLPAGIVCSGVFVF